MGDIENFSLDELRSTKQWVEEFSDDEIIRDAVKIYLYNSALDYYSFWELGSKKHLEEDAKRVEEYAKLSKPIKKLQNIKRVISGKKTIEDEIGFIKKRSEDNKKIYENSCLKKEEIMGLIGKTFNDKNSKILNIIFLQDSNNLDPGIKYILEFLIKPDLFSVFDKEPKIDEELIEDTMKLWENNLFDILEEVNSLLGSKVK